MLYIRTEDFFEQAASCRTMSRQEEIDCALRMKSGDTDARAQLIQSYTPMVAGHIRHMKPHLQTLGMVMYCMQALEKAVDSFDFLQDSETFTHRLSWHLRQASTKYMTQT